MNLARDKLSSLTIFNNLLLYIDQNHSRTHYLYSSMQK